MILIKLLPLWLTLSLMTAATRPERRRRDVFNRAIRWESPFELQRHRMWPKRSLGHYSRCSCAEVEGTEDLGPSYWPRKVYSRKCASNEASSDFTMSGRCEPDGEDISGVECHQRTHPIKVLRRREPNEQTQSSNTIPPELQEGWVFVEKKINTACEMIRYSDRPTR
ncbi:uncharacterized protein LOC135934125 [Cloeon dipterum]|uniref:uncharacterized protein LOC135934125 n=1 Tax=Cloeon dipterum TaxID=197152 RepID=UPI00321F8247